MLSKLHLPTLVVCALLLVSCGHILPLSEDDAVAKDQAIVFATVAVERGVKGSFFINSDDKDAHLVFHQDTMFFDYTPQRLLVFAVPPGRYHTSGWELSVDRRDAKLHVLKNKRAQPVTMMLKAGNLYYLGAQSINGIIGKSLIGTDIVVSSGLSVTDTLQADHSRLIKQYPRLKDWPVVSHATALHAGLTSDASPTADGTVTQ